MFVMLARVTKPFNIYLLDVGFQVFLKKLTVVEMFQTSFLSQLLILDFLFDFFEP